MSRQKRQAERYTKRFEIVFHVGDQTFSATTSNLSANGIFIRTRHCYKAGAPVQIELRAPDGDVLYLEGVIKRAIKTKLQIARNGMGVELRQPDRRYLDLVQGLGR